MDQGSVLPTEQAGCSISDGTNRFKSTNNRIFVVPRSVAKDENFIISQMMYRDEPRNVTKPLISPVCLVL